ncbi:MAG: hypothetical protein R2789_15855 [Microthrixaceae bacterium]
MSKLSVAVMLSALALFGCSSGDGGSASVDDFCDRMRASEESGKLDPDDDPESMAAAADEFTQLAEVAAGGDKRGLRGVAAAINELAERTRPRVTDLPPMSIPRTTWPISVR